MKIICLTSFIVLLASACKQRVLFWEISKFNIVDTALRDGEEIKLLYRSGAPGNNKALDYYIHIVAVSQKTGDTVNILTLANNGFSAEDADKVYNYFDQDNLASRLTQTGIDQLKDLKDIEQIEKIENKKISRVSRDPDFDDIADNNYPTVIGTIGTLTKTDQ